MEQPFHSIRVGQQKGITPQKAVGLAAAVLLQVGFIWALAAGLAATLIEKLPDELKVAVEQEKIPPKAPPPPPPQLETPPPPFVPPPDIVIQTEVAPATTISTTQVKAPVAEAKPAITSPASIGAKHYCDQVRDYPALSQKLQEQGTTTLSFKIDVNGSVKDPTVSNSSGYSRLDDATVSCVSKWHYKPAMQNGAPIEVPWQTAVKWQLH